MSSLELHRHNRTVLDKLKPGDRLQFERGLFQHWAVYVGNQKIVHLAGVRDQGETTLNHSFAISGVGIVRIDNFWSVAGDSKVYLDNSKDAKLRPYEPNRIVQRALSNLGEVGYDTLFKNCEQFASWCRYYTETETHNWTVLDHLEPGDLLKFDRGVYSHWAVYVGNDEVVHLAGVDGAGGRDLKHPCTISGVKSDKGIVRKDDFWTVTEDSKAEINNFKDLKFKPLEPSKIVQRALSKVREVGYNLLYKNCEHFATWCRYDIEKSDQAGLFAAVASFVGGAVVAGAGIALAVVFGSGRKEEREKRSKN
ncbi:uncharacterized protein LOC124269837 [Haliotis rubra]|uniref:uncharacterized protein LOC124269837 n=1 Tax=Haliotis rubra TaxID=36100 RepID=UPI001EE5C620|nr:uncharacterized protein LOC124269837 [Haliotis rubra]